MFKFLKRLKNEGWCIGFGHVPKNLTATWKPQGEQAEPPTNIIKFPTNKSPKLTRPLKHRKALVKLYESHGVGRTIKQRLNFWKTFNETYPVFSQTPTEKGEVAFLEEEWLTSEFPADFDYY